MAKTLEDVAQNLKARYLGHIDTISREYDVQISKWRPFFDLVADAQETAVGELKRVIKEAQKQDELLTALVMLALQFVGIGALGWLSKVVKTEVYPRVAGKVVWVDSFTKGGYQSVSHLSYDTERAAYFGEMIEKRGDKVVDKTLELLKPKDEGSPSRTATNRLRGAVSTPRFATFRTAIKAVFDEEILRVKTVLGALQAKTNIDATLGQRVLDLARRRTSGQSITPELLEEAGFWILDDFVDGLRQEYAKWFYFGNNPDLSALGRLAHKIEIELWATWFLDQDYKVTNKSDPLITGREVLGKDRIALKHSIVEHLLVDLGQTGSDMIDLEYDLQPTGGFIVSFEKEVDDADQLKVLETWAKRHPGMYTIGNVGYRPRDIGTVSDPSTIFK